MNMVSKTEIKELLDDIGSPWYYDSKSNVPMKEFLRGINYDQKRLAKKTRLLIHRIAKEGME